MEGLARAWRSIALRGAIAVLFGIVAFVRPALTLTSFIFLFGAFAAADGALTITAALRRDTEESRWPLLLGGLCGLAAGVLAVALPGLVGRLMLYMVAVWAIASGVAGLVAARLLRRAGVGVRLFALFGVLSVGLGVFLITRPVSAVLGFVWAIALWAIVAGCTLVVLGFRLRSWARSRGRA